MAAGLGFKDFVTGEVLTAADVDGYLMQGVWVFASAAARDAAVTSPQEGNFAYLKDTNVTTYYTGSAWANLDTTGMTNPMTTTGDIIYSSPGSTPVRLGIGSTGNVLTVAGGVPSWAAPAGGSSFVGCKLKMSATQSMSNNTKTTIAFPAEDFDTSSFHDNSTNNSRITIPAGKAGYYLVLGKIHWRGAAASNLRDVYIMKNGTDVELTSFGNVATTSADTAINCQTIVNCAEADYIQLAGYQSSGGALDYFSGTANTTLQVQYLGA